MIPKAKRELARVKTILRELEKTEIGKQDGV
jgi:ribosomal protein L29